MNDVRIIFMGTPAFAVPCLQMLIDERYTIPAVITQPDRPKGRGQKLAPSPVKEVAVAHNLTVFQPPRIKAPEYLSLLSALKPDFIVVVAFGQLLPQPLLDLPTFGCINVHASLLPLYRGAAPIHWSIIRGEKTTGVTTMFMDIGMDTGDMLVKNEIAIAEDDTTGCVHDKLSCLGADTLRVTLESIQNGTIQRVKQATELATYAPLLTRAIERINWQLPAVEIHNLIRGLTPWPGAYCRHRDKSLKVWNSKIHDPAAPTSHPGRIAAISPQAVVVETGCGLLELCEVQPENKRRISTRDYVSGYNLAVGESLE